MKTSIDFIKRGIAFWRLFAFAAFLPMEAGAYTTGSASATYTCSLSGSGFTWHMGANIKENNGTGVFPTEVILLYCSYTSPSSVADLTIPGSLTWDSKGSAGTRLLPLTTIAAGAFRNCADIKTVTLPRSLKTVKLPCFKGCSNLSSINVSLAQVTDTYASENGVLFGNDKYQKTKLVKYPEGKTDSSYAVPSTVTNLADSCFANAKLSTIVFSGSPPPTVASTAFSGSSASVLYPQGASGWTSPWNGVNTYAIPNAVTGLKATQGTSQTQVTVTWTANAVAKSYVVYRAESTGGSKVTLGTIGSGSTVFSDTTATAGKTYYYWVKAVNGPAESGLGSYVQGWKAGSYTVTLDAQGGTGGTASVTATYGSSMPAIAVPSRLGYTFGGYYTSTGGGGTQYYTASGTSAHTWDKTAATTLYAKWTGNSYTVTLDAQSGSGGTASVTATYGSAMPSITVPTRTGYTFGGYYTATNGGGTQYYTASGTSARGWDKTAATTLYAKWTDNSYTVTLDAQSGSGGTASVTATYGEAMPSITVPSLVDYIFGGYYSEPDGGGTQYYTSSGTSARAWDRTETTTLYAQWTLEICPDASWFYSLTNGTAIVTGAEPAKGKLLIPGVLEGCPVVGIGSNAFEGCADLTSVDIPESVTKVGGAAFSGCTNLNAVHIHNLSAWCRISFNSAYGNPLFFARHLYLDGVEVTDLEIPQDVTQLKFAAFSHFSGLSSVAFHDNVRSIGQSSFSHCNGLTNIVFGNGVTSIGDWGFGECNGLTEVTIPDSVTSIGQDAFYQCDNLNEVTIGNCVTSISDGMFVYCDNLYKVTIGNGVTAIGSGAFAYCPALTTLTIPGSVKSVGRNALNCPRLKTLCVPASWKGTDILANAEVPNGCSIVYYEWDGVVTVAFDANGGSCTSRSGKYTVGEPFGNLPTAWREGHRFSGWWTTAAEGVQVGTETVVDGAAILYARWTANTYAVTLDAQGGTGGTASVPATYGEAVPSIGVPAREGYTFGGYYTSTNGTGTQYYTDRGTSARTWDRTDATTLYAAWTPNTYTISLDAQGGSNGTASVAATYGEAMPTIAVPVREGYAFGGYYTSTGGSGTQYYAADGAGVRAWDRTAATTLHAVWKPLAVATPVITPADGSVFVEETCEVSIGCATEGAAIYYTTDGTTPRIAEAFRYTAPFTLSGTATVKAVASVDGLKSGYAAATITRRILTLAEAAGAPNLAFTTGGIAEWKPVVDGLAGNGFAAQSGKIPPNGETWLEVSVSGPGTFLFDWKVDCEADDSGNATWDRLSASVDGGERLRIDGTTGWASVAFPLEGSGEHIIRWTFSKDGYDEEGAACSDRAWVSGVAWEPVDEPWTAAVAFDAHGGSCAVESREYPVGEPYGELPEAVRPGYTFAGWWTAAAGGTRVGTDTVADAATTVLHARWTANTYVVTLDAQGGTGGTTAVVATFDKALPAIGIPSRPECVFGGYFPETDGRGTPYYGADGQGVRTWDVADDVTLYAKWTEITHTQTVDGIAWTYVLSNGTAIVSGAVPAKGNLVMPSQLGGRMVTGIGIEAFCWRSNLTGFAISGGVTDIGGAAFYGCGGLTNMLIPNGVTNIGGLAFYKCKELARVTIPASVKSIGHNAFTGCRDLLFDTTSIPGVRLADGWAVGFSDSIPPQLDLAGIRGIAQAAFSECNGLWGVEIPPGVPSIADDAFAYCKSLAGVQIPGSVTRIGNRAFISCTNLANVVIPEGVTDIGTMAFRNCSRLTNVVVSGSVTNIGREAFAASGLKNLALPDSVTSIGNLAFGGSKLETLFVPASWEGTAMLSAAGVPEECRIVYRNPEGTETVGGVEWTYFAGDEGATITGAKPAEGNVEVPATLGGCPVKCIGSNVFAGCSGLTSIAIPHSVERIGPYAFSGCTNLTAVYIHDLAAWCEIEFLTSWDTPLSYGGHLYLDGQEVSDLVIPAGVTELKFGAFTGCSGLTNVVVPDGIAKIGQSAFYACRNLGSAVISDTVTEIGDSAFSLCTGLTNVLIGAGVTNLGNWAFAMCAELKTLVIPDSVVGVGEKALFYCEGLERLYVPASWKGTDMLTVAGVSEGCAVFFGGELDVKWEYAVTNGTAMVTGAKPVLGDLVMPAELGGCPVTALGEHAFHWCSDLTGIAISGNVTNIGAVAFGSCGSLTNVVIPASVAVIGRSAFSFCTGLPGLSIPDGVADIAEEAFVACSSLTNVAIPGSVGSIGIKAFADCVALKDAVLADGVANIGPRAFEGCGSLTNAAIPGSVTNIGGYAFSDCGALAKLTIPGSVESIGWNAFAGSGLEKLVVPASWRGTSMLAEAGVPMGCAILYCGIVDGVAWAYAVTNGAATVTGAEPAVGDLTMPSSLDGHPVTDIGEYAFAECGNLTGIALSGNVTNIGWGAFALCGGLTNVVIPDSVKRVGDVAFGGCAGLKAVVLPDSVVFVGTSAFAHSGLERLYVPASWEGTAMLSNSGVPEGCTVVYGAAPEEEATSTGVPHAWIDANAADILAANNGDHEAAAKAPAANGCPVWECYVAGLSPTDPAADFKITSISFADGEPVIEWYPDLNAGGTKADRTYVVESKASMEGEWGPCDATSRFFRVRVVLGQETPEPDPHKGVQLWQDGPYWAETNIGAESPEDYGLYFWWGDTVGYRWEGDAWAASDGSTANFSFDEANTPTYRKDNATLQSEGWITAERALAPEHDAAQVHWGGGWRMPTDAEFADLIANTTTTWTTSNGVHGRLVTGKGEFASASIFLPAAGDGYGTSLELSGSYGDYWSSTPYSSYSTDARYLKFYSGDFARYNGSPRLTGQSVRALRGFAE